MSSLPILISVIGNIEMDLLDKYITSAQILNLELSFQTQTDIFIIIYHSITSFEFILYLQVVWVEIVYTIKNSL